MSATSGENRLSLTGLWNGLFSYPRLRDPTQFVAILIQSVASFSGTTHEPCATKQTPGGVLYATLQGQRSGTAVAFIVRPTPQSDPWRHDRARIVS